MKRGLYSTTQYGGLDVESPGLIRVELHGAKPETEWST